MKKEYTPAYLFYFASAGFFLAGIINAVTEDKMSAVWICLGTTFLCLGSSRLVSAGRKLREEEEISNHTAENGDDCDDCDDCDEYDEADGCDTETDPENEPLQDEIERSEDR